MARTCAVRVVRALHKTWMRLQVELHGQYSNDRLLQFHAYCRQTTWIRILWWCVAVPIPCLVFNILLDAAPLEDPSAGREANWVFWIRCFLFSFGTTYGIFSQIRFLTPSLGMTSRDVLLTTSIVTVACVVYDYIITGWIRMPVPFFFLTGTPPFFIATAAVFSFLVGKRLIQDAELRIEFMRTGGVFLAQSGLQTVYPLFLYGFNAMPSDYQASYMTLAPFLKIAFKNVMTGFVVVADFKPEVLIFIVDMFHAVYISLAMQRAATLSTSLLVMIVDVIQACVSVYDVYSAYQSFQHFVSKLPLDHPLRKQTLLEVAVALHHLQRKRQSTSDSRAAKVSNPRIPASSKVRVGPAKSIEETFGAVSTLHGAQNVNILASVCSYKDQAACILVARRLLFTIEFVMLTEYTEVIIPIFYSILMTAEYYLPNRRFYAAIASINEHELQNMVATVLGYAVLELLSLVVFSYVLRRITGMPPMCQVGFVLETQYKLIQSKMFMGVLYAAQNSLEHLGADYSFQFKWLRNQ